MSALDTFPIPEAMEVLALTGCLLSMPEPKTEADRTARADLEEKIRWKIFGLGFMPPGAMKELMGAGKGGAA